jgi:adenylylsulfate kinase
VEPFDRHLTPCVSPISYSDRCSLLKQTGCVIWMTGLSGAGKSTIAADLERELYQKNKLSYWLDGDNIRGCLNRDLAFSAQDRIENIRRIVEVAKLFCDAGLITIVSCISPHRHMRQWAKSSIGESRFVEIYIQASLAACQAKDPKKIYAKREKGEIKELTGIDASYEIPKSPSLILNTEVLSRQEAKACLLRYLSENSII